MARIYNTFEFIGNLNISQDTEKFHRVNKKDSGWEGHNIRFAVNESSNNGQFVELFGGFDKNHPFPVKTSMKGKRDAEGNYIAGGTIEIPFDERLDEVYVRKVSDFRKIIVDLTTEDEAKQEGNQLRYQIRQLEEKEELTKEEEDKIKELYKEHDEKVPNRHEFLHQYDAVLFMAKELINHKDLRFRVTGNVNFNFYQDKVQKRFEIQTIEVVTNEELNNGLKVTADLHFAKDAVDKDSFKDDKKLRIQTYVLSYERETKQDQFFPLQVIIDANKLNLEDDRHKGILKFITSKFEVKDRKSVNHLPFELKVLRGSEEVEFDESKLTPEQKEAIEFGFNTLDDFKPKGKVFGDSVEEFRVIKPLLKEFGASDFKSGALDAGITPDDLIFVPEKKENSSLGEEVAEDTKPKEEVKMRSAEEEMDALFG